MRQLFGACPIFFIVIVIIIFIVFALLLSLRFDNFYVCLAFVPPFLAPSPVSAPPLHPCRQPPPSAWDHHQLELDIYYYVFFFFTCLTKWAYLILLFVGLLVVDVDNCGTPCLCSSLDNQYTTAQIFVSVLKVWFRCQIILHSPRSQCQHRSLYHLLQCPPSLNKYDVWKLLWNISKIQLIELMIPFKKKFWPQYIRSVHCQLQS